MPANAYPHLVFATDAQTLPRADLQGLVEELFAGREPAVHVEQGSIQVVVRHGDYALTFWYDDDSDGLGERYAGFAPTLKRRRISRCTTMIDASGDADPDGSHAGDVAALMRELAQRPGVYVFSEEAKAFVGLDEEDPFAEPEPLESHPQPPLEVPVVRADAEPVEAPAPTAPEPEPEPVVVPVVVAPETPEPAAPMEPEPAAPVEPEPAAPVESEPAAPVEPEPAAPFEPEPAAPFEPEPAAPVEPEPAAPVEPEPAAPVEPEHPAPVDPESAPAPVEADTAAPAQPEPETAAAVEPEPAPTPAEESGEPEKEGGFFKRLFGRRR